MHIRKKNVDQSDVAKKNTLYSVSMLWANFGMLWFLSLPKRLY